MATELIEAYRKRISIVGWSETSRRSGVCRETLYRCFNACTSPPTMRTLERVGKVIGLRVTAVPT